MDSRRQTRPWSRGDGRGEYRQGPRHPLRISPSIPRPEPGDFPAPVQLDPDEQGRSITAVARVLMCGASCLLAPDAKEHFVFLALFISLINLLAQVEKFLAWCRFMRSPFD